MFNNPDKVEGLKQLITNCFKAASNTLFAKPTKSSKPEKPKPEKAARPKFLGGVPRKTR